MINLFVVICYSSNSKVAEPSTVHPSVWIKGSNPSQVEQHRTQLLRSQHISKGIWEESKVCHHWIEDRSRGRTKAESRDWWAVHCIGENTVLENTVLYCIGEKSQDQERGCGNTACAVMNQTLIRHNTSSWSVWEGNLYQSAPELKVMNSEFILCEDAKKVLIFIIKEEFKGQQSGWSCRDFKS